MDPKHYAALRALYDQVIDLPWEERVAKLQALGAAPAMVAEVMTLMMRNETDFAAQIAKPIQRMLTEKPSPLNAGDTLGVWRIAREIGQGGMGSVYLVERIDGHFEQRAALKFVKGLPRTDTLTLFSRERQLLATLTHPNIARLLDGGTTPEGQPYLVMEYIDGIAIDAYCREHKLDMTAILRLFSAACDAVAFAHRQLIVHCDLKPSNLMINRDGRPVLLDFGIARMLDRVGAEANDAAIGSSVAYTPRYASPEQREHGVVSTVSDIYGLGIMLGELLAQLPGAAAQDDAELQAILAKATANEPANRYATVDALTGDIARYLRKQPLAAIPPAMPYLAKKFLQRRWPLVLAGVAFIGTVLGFTWRVIGESQRAQAAEKVAIAERDATQIARKEALVERDSAQRERDRAAEAEKVAALQRNNARDSAALAVSERDRARGAERNAVDERNKARQAEASARQAEASARQAETAARQTSDFLVSIFANTDPTAETGDVPASQLIAKAETQLETQMLDQPGTRAELYGTLARALRNMGKGKEAIKNIERALAIERTLDRPQKLIGLLIVGALAHRDTDADRVVAYAREALDISERIDADSFETGKALMVYGNWVSEARKPEDGAPYIARGLAIMERIDPKSVYTADGYFAQGLNRDRLGDYKGAMEGYARAEAMRLVQVGEGHYLTLKIRRRMAMAMTSLGRHQEAADLHAKVLAGMEKLYGRDNVLVAEQRSNVATALIRIGRPFEALQMYPEILDVTVRASGKEHVDYVLVLNAFALAHYNTCNYPVAEPMFREALESAVKVFKGEGFGVAQINRNIGLNLVWLERNEEAMPYFEASEREFRKLGQVGVDAASITIAAMAAAEAERGRVNQARALLAKLAAERPFRNNVLREYDARIGAWIAEAEGRHDDALRGFLDAESVLATVNGEDSFQVWRARVFRAEYLFRHGRRASHPASIMAAAVLGRDIAAHLAGGCAPTSPLFARMERLQLPAKL